MKKLSTAMLVACLAAQSVATTSPTDWTGAFGFEFWGIPANWDNGVPNSAGAQAVFPTAVITTPTTVNLSNGPYTVGSLSYAGDQPLVFELGTLIFDQDGAGAGQAQIVLGSVTTTRLELNSDIIVNDDLSIQSASVGNSIEFQNPISGSGNINLIGSGVVEFANLNNSPWTGQLNINDNIQAVVSMPTGLGSSAVGTVIHGGALVVNAATSEPVTVNDGGALILNPGGAIGALTSHGGLVQQFAPVAPSTTLGPGNTLWQLNSNATFSAPVTGFGNLTVQLGQAQAAFNSAFDFAGGLTLLSSTANPVVEFNAASTYTGLTTLPDGTYNLNHGQGLGSDVSGTTLSAGTINVNAVSTEPFTLGSGTTLNVLPGAGIGSFDSEGDVYLDGVVSGDGIMRAGGRVELNNGGAIDSLTSYGGTYVQRTATNAPVHLAAGDTDWFFNTPVLNSVISGPGNVSFYNGGTIQSASTYTGTTNILGDVTLANADGFGSTSAPTIVGQAHPSNTLAIATLTDEPIIAVGVGVVRFEAVGGTHTNPVTLAGGRIQAPGGYGGALTVDGQGFVLSGQFSGTIGGDGDLSVGQGTGCCGPTLVADINAVNTFQGQVIGYNVTRYGRPDVFNQAERLFQNSGELILANGLDRTVAMGDTASLVLESDATLNGLWVINSDAVVNGTLTADRLVGGKFADENNEPAGAIVVTDLLVMRGGLVASTLSGSANMLLLERSHSFWGDASGLTGDITVIHGSLGGNNDQAFGSPGTTIRFARGSTGSIRGVTTGGTFNQTTGVIHQHIDATATDYARIGGQTTGDITLSTSAELVGSELIIYGSLSGADLTLLQANLAGDMSGLTGGLTVSNYSRRAPGDNIAPQFVRVSEHAALPNIDSIVIEGGSTFFIDNESLLNPALAPIPDRVPDGVPIYSEGSTLRFRGSRVSGVTERVGDLVLRAGHSDVITSGFGSTAVLEISSLIREGRSTVNFNKPGPSPASARLLNPPVAPGQMIGPWATRDDGFAIVNSLGYVTTLPPSANDLNTAGPSDIVQIIATLQTLTSPKTVQAVIVADTPLTNQIDLGGHRLTVQSGGMRLLDTTTISNGELTAGGDELIFSSNSIGNRLTLDAEVTDNTGPVALVIDTLEARLNSNLTHTGGTWVFDSEVDVYGQHLAAGSDLTVVNSELTLRATTNNNYSFDEITIDNGGSLYGLGTAEFNTLRLRDGDIGIELVGNGQVIHDGFGSSRINNGADQFTGDIIVERGWLDVSLVRSEADITINGGTFRSGDEMTAAGSPIVLNGGTLGGGRDENRGILRNISITAESLLSRVAIESTVTGSHRLHVRKSVGQGFTTFSGNDEVYIHEADFSGFTGGWLIESSVLHARPEASGLGSGAITILPGASLSLIGSASAQPANNPILLDGGGRIYADGQAVLTGDVTASGIVLLETDTRASDFLELAGHVTLMDGLSIIGPSEDADLGRIGTIRISGEVLVGNDVRWNPQFSNIDVTGTVRPGSNDASILIAGYAWIPGETATYQTESGKTLTLLDDVGPGTLNLQDAGRVTGDGTLRADVSSTLGAMISPGEDNPTVGGVLTIDGDLTIGEQGVLSIWLGGNQQGAHTSVLVLGSAVLDTDSLLNVTLSPTYTPIPTDSFTILTADSLNGLFENVPDMIIADNYVFKVNYYSDRVVLSDPQFVPEPTSLVLLGLGGLLASRRRRPLPRVFL